MAALLGLAPSLLPAAAATNDAGPLPPARARASFQLEPNLRVELVAAEPLTAAPCALAWDERGRLFVAENRGYPTGGPNGQPMGVIALLEDTDADGAMDRRTVFADQLSFPNGLQPWRGGLIVTCAPDVLWLADTNGDGRADVRRVLLTGFTTNGSTQLRVSHPTLGPDGWVWLTCGLSGGQITSPQHPSRLALKTVTDVRFHPDTLEVEAVDGRGQFGQSFDDFGRRFICMNRVQVQHVVLSSRFLQRNPHLAFTETVQNCPELVPNPWLQGGGGAARLYPRSANVTTADSHAGTFTAACGLHIYRGDALPGRYRGLAFSCDPTGNLVHWDELVPTGATFAARRSAEPVEFLASTDNWFRPVFLATGPEGALYIADMYRRTIEHPDYLPVEIRKRTDFESGREMGRIWRVTRIPEPPPGRVPGLPAPPETLTFDWKRPERRNSIGLGTATTEQLCRSLQDLNGWRRDTAFRLLVERRDPASVPTLRAEASLPALRLLQLLDALDDVTLARAGLDDGTRLVEQSSLDGLLELLTLRPHLSLHLQKRLVRWIRWDNRAGLLAKLLTQDLPYEQKRSELLTASGGDAHGTSLPPLDPGQPPPAEVGGDDLDRWQRAALLSSLTGQAAHFLGDWTEGAPRFHASPALFFELGRLAAIESSASELRSLSAHLADFAIECAQTEDATRRSIEASARTGSRLGMLPHGPRPVLEWELPALHGIAEGLRGRAPDQGAATLLSQLSEPGTAQGRSRVDAIAVRSRFALTNDQPVVVRVAAVALLASLDQQEDRDRLLNAFRSDASPSLQRASSDAFVQLAGTNAVYLLLRSNQWRGYTPTMRESTLAALFSHPIVLPAVVDAIELGMLPIGALGPTRRNSLLKHRAETIRSRAEALFQKPDADDRMQAYERSKAALKLAANTTNGREVFRRTCAPCHRLDREGVAVGPDLFGIRNQPKETILLHLIVPELEIAPNFMGYTLETKDGRTLSGLITGESPAAVTLRQAMGVEETVPRANIASLDAMQLSLMPQELEKSMTLQELADLLAYLKGEQ